MSHDAKQPQSLQEAPPDYAESQYRVLQVDFKWRKFNVVITEPARREPLYLATFNPWKMTTKFKAGESAVKALGLPETDAKSSQAHDADNDIVGDSQVHPFKIDCHTHVRGHPIRVSAAKKWLTRYQYPSLAYATTPGKPAIMTWKSNSKFKVFDMDLLDENDQPVAKFSPRYLGVRRMATIEMLGQRAHDQLAVDEVVITGLSLYFTMIYRSSSFVPFIGAIVARPNKDYKVTEQDARNDEESSMAVSADEFLGTKDSKVEDHEKVWELVDADAKG